VVRAEVHALRLVSLFKVVKKVEQLEDMPAGIELGGEDWARTTEVSRDMIAMDFIIASVI